MPIKRKPNGPQAAPGGQDRREGGRVVQPKQVAVYPCLAEGLGRPIRASLTDTSPTSIGLTCLGHLPMGMQFVLRRDRPNGPPVLQVFRVVRCREAGGGASLVGAQYNHDFAGTCPINAPAASTSVAAAC